MSKTTLLVNVGGDPPPGVNGIIGEAEVEITPGGIYFRVTLADETLPTLGFDRDQLNMVIIRANLDEAFPVEGETS